MVTSISKEVSTSEDGGSKHIRNISNYSPESMGHVPEVSIEQCCENLVSCRLSILLDYK